MFEACGGMYLRVLVRHLSEHVGDLLSSVSEPQELFVSIAHAALGMLLC
jgi:hypothetical protein